MNETRHLMFGLKMSPTPGEKNRRLPHEMGGVGWKTVPPYYPAPREGCHGTCQCLVMSSSPAPALFPSLTLYTGQPLLDNVAILCN